MNKFELYRARIRGFTGDEFLARFKEICEKLQTELNILTFGIILYDESTPEVRKVLRDPDYWDALDRASGDHLVIFTLADRTESRSEARVQFRMLSQFSGVDPSKTVSYSRLMKNVFGDERLLVFPSVLFFQVADSTIHNYRIVPLKRRRLEDSARSVQDLFSSMATVLRGVAPQNYGNYREIFVLIEDELRRQEYTIYLLKGPLLLAEFVAKIKGIVN